MPPDPDIWRNFVYGWNCPQCGISCAPSWKVCDKCGYRQPSFWRRKQAAGAVELATTTTLTLGEALRKVHESGSRPISGSPYLAPYFAKQKQQLDWLRASLERDEAPRWLIEMVLERWVYQPEWHWD